MDVARKQLYTMKVTHARLIETVKYLVMYNTNTFSVTTGLESSCHLRFH